jgi:hypothetical protein
MRKRKRAVIFLQIEDFGFSDWGWGWGFNLYFFLEGEIEGER